jgi:hypothetical protein
MGRKRSEIAMPFNQTTEPTGGLLPSEAQFYSED